MTAPFAIVTPMSASNPAPYVEYTSDAREAVGDLIEAARLMGEARLYVVKGATWSETDECVAFEKGAGVEAHELCNPGACPDCDERARDRADARGPVDLTGTWKRNGGGW